MCSGVVIVIPRKGMGTPTPEREPEPPPCPKGEPGAPRAKGPKGEPGKPPGKPEQPIPSPSPHTHQPLNPNDISAGSTYLHARDLDGSKSSIAFLTRGYLSVLGNIVQQMPEALVQLREADGLGILQPYLETKYALLTG